MNAKIMLKKVYDDYIKRYGNELDIKILEDKRKHIKKNIKNLKFENNDVVENTNSLKTLELFIKKHKKQYDNSSKQINKFEKNIEKMKEEKHNLLFSKEKLYIVEYDKKHYNKIIEDNQDDSYRSKFEDLVNKYDSNDIKRKKFIDKIMEISNLMVSSSDNIILAKDQIKKITKNKTIKKSNDNIEKKIIELEEKIKSAEVELVEYNYFIQKYKDTIDEKNKLDNENKDIEIKNGKKELDLEKYNQKLEKLDENIKELKNIDNSEIENIDKNIDKIDKNIIKIEEEINKVENIISEYEMNEKDLEDLLIKKKETEFLIKNSDLEISKFENSINKLQIKIQELTELNKDDIIKNIEDEKKEIEDIKKEYDLCVANIALFEEDIKIITRTFDKLNIINEDDILCCLIKKIFDNHVGIAGYLIKEKLIPSIQATTNKVLEEAGFNHEIKFSLDGDKLNMSVNKTKEYVYDIDIKYNSGFEKDMINIIMMYIFTQINTKLRSNFIIIDEPFSSADNSNIENMKNMLLHWKHIFDYIIIISHNSDIKDEYDQSINIINNGNTSKVYYPANKENYKNK